MELMRTLNIMQYFYFLYNIIRVYLNSSFVAIYLIYTKIKNYNITNKADLKMYRFYFEYLCKYIIENQTH